MGAVASLGSALSSVVKDSVSFTKKLTNFGTNDIGGVLRDLGEITGDPVLAKLGIGLHEAQERSQTIKDIEANAPKAAALYLGGEYLYGLFGGAGAGGAAGAAGGGATGAGAGGTGAAVAGAGAVGGGLSDVAGQGAGAAAAGAAGTASQTSSIIAEIGAVITKVVSAIDSFIKPLTDTVNEINNGIIKPIVGPIQTIMEEQASLRDFIKGDLHSGIMGILKLPGDVADALTSVDASFTRAIQQLTAGQATAFGDGLNQYGPNVGSTGQTLIAGGISSALPGEPGKWVAPQRLTLSESFDLKATIDSALAVLQGLQGSEHWYDRLWTGFFSIIDSGLLLTANNEPYVDAVHEAARMAHPFTKLQVTDTLTAWRRGIIDEGSMRAELATYGYDGIRVDALIELSRAVPTASDYIQWKLRGQLTAEELNTALLDLGFEQEDVARYVDAAATLPSAQDALNWWHRGLLADAGLTQLLTAMGYDAETQTVLQQGSYLLPQLADMITLYDRELALIENAGANLAADTVPAPYIAEARRLGISAADASVLWANHLQLLPPGMAVSSYFRGYINSDQLYAFTRAVGFTRDMTDMLVDASRPQLPYRTIPTLVKAGILDEASAVTELKGLGFTDIAVDRLLKLALTSTKATGTSTAATIHKDVQQTTMGLYDAGTFTREQADAALQAAGLEPDAATAMLNLADVKNTAAIHKTEIETVAVQVQAGTLTVEQGDAALATFGLNDRERAQATTKLNTIARRRSKVPTEGTLLAMLRRGILTETETTSNLVLLGYTQAWADKLVQLEIAEHGPPAKS